MLKVVHGGSLSSLRSRWAASLNHSSRHRDVLGPDHPVTPRLVMNVVQIPDLLLLVPKLPSLTQRMGEGPLPWARESEKMIL